MNNEKEQPEGALIPGLMWIFSGMDESTRKLPECRPPIYNPPLNYLPFRRPEKYDFRTNPFPT